MHPLRATHVGRSSGTNYSMANRQDGAPVSLLRDSHACRSPLVCDRIAFVKRICLGRCSSRPVSVSTPVRALVALSCLGLATSLAAKVREKSLVRLTPATPATSCVDPGLHFTVRDFRGAVLDEKGKPVPNVRGELFRFRKSKIPSKYRGNTTISSR